MRASIARTERVKLPPLPEALTRTETIAPLTAPQTGELVSVPKAFLAELIERLAEAVAAVGRGNVRAVAVRQERTCLDAIISTGTTPAGCTTDQPR